MMTTTVGATAAEVPVVAKKGHPLGLYILFATEMWERFSYYGMRALLVGYMIFQIQWQPGESSKVYKWYTSLVYLTPLVGGFVADRYLGLRASIVIGGILMAIGHFLMAFEPLPIFFSALAFLVAGNGFFKPNISTLVGKMYTKNDPRRDGAFTILYMGINAGALLSPIVCGSLRDHFGYHYGFAAAGVGMVIGLITFLFGQRRVVADVAAAGNDLGRYERTSDAAGARELAGDENEARAPGTAGTIAGMFPWILVLIAVLVPAYYLVQFLGNKVHYSDVIMPIAFACVAGWMGLTLRGIRGAARDKSTVIFVLFVFTVLFWMAFEQAGNALSIWAYVHTDLHLGSWQYPAEWFQSVNPIFILVLGPVFAAMWVALARRKLEVPTGAKFLAAVVFMALSFAAMVGGAASENTTVSSVPLAELPARVDLSQVDAGRMSYDERARELRVRGVLAPFAVTAALKQTVDPAYAKSVEDAEEALAYAGRERPVTTTLGPLPPAFELPFVGVERSELVQSWEPETGRLTAIASLSPAQKTKLMGAGAPAAYRASVTELAERSDRARVSGFWLLLSYFLATLGELCISPVGLSMVTKLAPARFASLFMGVWLLTNSVAQYVGGTLGELWGEITPTAYFGLFVWTSLVGAAVLVLLVRPVKKLMHGVN